MRTGLSVLALAVSIGIACPVTVFAQWENADVDVLAGSAADEMSNRFSLAVDAEGTPHALWAASFLGFYSHRDASGDWIAPVEIGDDSAHVTPHAIAIAPGSTEPVILYSRRAIGEPAGDLHLGVWNGGGFDPVPLESAALAEHSPALAVDAGGRYHVTCVSEIAGTWRLRYLTNVTGVATDTPVDAGPLGDFGSGAAPSVAAEADGRVRIVYRGVTGGAYRIHHVANDAPGGSSWSWETLVTPNGEDLTGDIDIDAAGDAHVAVSGNDCFGCSPRTYYLRRPAGGAWAPPIFIALTTGLTSPSVVADASGTPHVAMAEVTGNIYTGRLYYASAANGWMPVLVIGTDHAAPSLGVDGEGYGHLVCTTGPNTGVEDVLYLRSDARVVSVEDAEPVQAPARPRLVAVPNPFVHATVFRVATGVEPHALEVYDALGRRVRLLEMVGNGRADVVWDGRRDDGTPVAPGAYFVRTQAAPAMRPVKVVRRP